MGSRYVRGGAAWLALGMVAACGGRESLFGGRVDDDGRPVNAGGSAGRSAGRGGRASSGTVGGGPSATGGFGRGGASGFGAGGGALNTGGSVLGGGAGIASGGFSPGGAGGVATGGVGGLTSGAGGSVTGGSSSGGAAGSGGGPAPMLGGACTPNGALACHGAAQRLLLLCDGGVWRSNGTCAETENCNQKLGVCSTILADCKGWPPGTRYCAGNTLMECGPDLVDANALAECEGRCAETSFSAYCSDPACGDGAVQEAEECDDGNSDDSDSCTSACQNAKCGDGAVWEGHETCDDGDLVAGDQCSVLCGWEPVSVAAGMYHTCALGVNGRVQCWGLASSGQLGLGDATVRGDTPDEMGPRLPVVDLGANRTVARIDAGFLTSCALFSGGAVKCWGANGYGGLGLGDVANRGAQSSQMGDNLPEVPLGGAAASLAIGQGHTCALLEDGRVKCWGYNHAGQLGLGTTDARGDVAYEMENLPFVDLGSGVTAQAIAAGIDHTCALLGDGGIKCWGQNLYGQLGLGTTDARGDEPGEMGDQLPRVDLGGLAARTVGTGEMHTCALLEDGSVRCWGRNTFGGLGIGSLETRGDDPSEMGAGLLPVDLGTGKTAVELAVGSYFNCALLNDSSVKCWGYNGNGSLGIGDAMNRGDNGGEMGDTLPAVNLGTGRHALSISAGMGHACALLDNRTIKCWGYNVYGQLGLGDAHTRGDAASEMGDLLPPTFVSF